VLYSRIVSIILLLLFLTSCMSHPNLAGRRGNAIQNAGSLKEQREARLLVKVYETTPIEATDKQDINSQRCHQYIGTDRPSDEALLDDLKIAAYALGLDGISEIRFKNEGGLLKNCWYVKRGFATGFRIKAEKSN
jgi:hypothetical protein